MDFKKFKKISSDSKSTTLKSPEGHKVIIAHHALSPKMRKQINDIPTKYADGGEVDEDSGRSPASLLRPETAQAASDKKLSISDKERAALDAIKSQEGSLPSDNFGPARPAPGIMDRINSVFYPQDQQDALARKQWEQGRATDNAALMAPQQGPAPASLGQPGLMASAPPPPESMDPYGFGAQAKQMQQGFGQEMLGAKNLATAKAAEGNEQARAADQHQQDLNHFMQVHEQKFQDLQQERQNILKDIDNGHINPNHYQESQSTGQKVLTTIGLILGGMAAGWNGGENQARKWLNGQIDRDIDSQKMELGKKQSLLSANLQAFGNLRDAETMTRVNLNDIYSSQVAKAAAKSMGPQAAAQAQMFIGQKNNDSAQLLQPLTMKLAGTAAMNGARTPEDKIRLGAMTGQIPPKDAEDMYKELNAVKNHAAQTDAVLKYFDRASGDNTLTNRAMHAGFEPASVAGFQNTIMPYLKDAEGRINETELERTDKMLPRPGDSAEKQKQKREALVDFLHEKSPAAERLRTYRMEPEQFGRFNNQGQKRIQLGPPVPVKR